MQTCGNCGQEADAAFPRCGQCGARLDAEAASPEIRRDVTIVTSDLKGSTALGEMLDPESLREILTLYFDEMRQVFESHGGTIEKIIGDAIVAVFGLPTPCADDALRAVRAASETQSVASALNERLEARWGVRLINRTGIATGEVVVGAASAGEHLLTGAVLQIAGKLEQSSPPSEVLIAGSTHELVAGWVTVEAVEPVVPKGSTEPVAAYRLLAVNAPAAVDGVASGIPEDPTVRICMNCGTENPLGFRYCGACGAPLVAKRSHETRKTVTIVFSDLKASSIDGMPILPAKLGDVMTSAFAQAREALARHGGTIEKYIGDAVMAVFGLPVRHEDDALRAVRAALEMRRALAALAQTLEQDDGIHLDVNIGVNTGEVVAGEATQGQRLVTGDAVNVAARLEQAATSLEVLIGQPTYSLVRDHVEVEEVEPLTLKGKAQPVRAYRLLATRSAADLTREEAPMVGREAELAVLSGAFESVVAHRVCRMVTLIGDAGVGKSRLTQEFVDSVAASARIVRGRCLPYGDGITFWPIVEVVRGAAGIGESDTGEEAREKLRAVVGDDEIAERVGAAIGLVDAPFQVAELFWGIRRFLEVLAVERPIAVVFDDIHWAEATFLELIERLAATVEDAPVMILCTSRRELLEKQPTWADAPNEARILLGPLSDAASRSIVENLLGEAALHASVQDKVLAAAEGNPLFVQQLLSMLIDSGMLRSEDGRWVPAPDLAQISIPPTIHALLAARLDQLPDDERSVVDPASVIGLVFPQAALESMVEDDVRPEIPVHLESLAAKQLMRAEAETAASYRFGHLMIRDAAYAGLLKRTRARLHEAFVAWADVANRASDRETEFEEILGYHMEQAYHYRVALAPLDYEAIAVGLDASRRLGSAGRRAVGRGDMPAAVNLLERASKLLAAGHADRPRMLLDLGYARFETGEYGAAEAALQDSIASAAGLGEVGQETSARLELLLQRILVDPGKVEGRVEDHVAAAVPVLERLGDEDGLARASLLLANLRIMEGQWEAAARAIEQVIVYAQRLGDRVREIRLGPQLASFAMLGPTPVEQAITITEEVIGRSGGERKSEAVLLRTLAHLHAMQGRFDSAREEYRRGRAMLEELGWVFLGALTSLDSGPIEMLAGDPAAAESELRRDYQTLDRLGERSFITTVAAYLAEAMYRQGRTEEADRFASFSAEVAAPDDILTQLLWRGVRAKLLALEGEFANAERLASEAVELSRGSDDVISQANALMDLAEVRRVGGHEADAASAAREALDLYTRKGNVVSARRAKAFLKPEAPDASLAPLTTRRR